jgi:hypothetical protein
VYKQLDVLNPMYSSPHTKISEKKKKKMDSILESEVRKLSQQMAVRIPSQSLPRQPGAAPREASQKGSSGHPARGAAPRGANGSSAHAVPTTHQDNEAELKRKEAALRDAVRNRQHMLQKESKQLVEIEAQLSALAAMQQGEINALRKQLESVDKQLSVKERDTAKKKLLYETAQADLLQCQEDKTRITEQLTALVLKSEKIRDEKLNELKKRVGS